MLQSDTPASDCEGLGRACTAAAKELIAARKLIAGYEETIIAFDARLDLARRELQTLKEAGALETERARKLEAVIAAEREAKAALVAIRDEQAKRVAKLEKKLSRSRKFALITGVAAAVGILIAIGK